MAYAAKKTKAAAKPDESSASLPSLETKQSWIEDWYMSTVDARAEMARNERYYYGKQRTRNELDELRNRGQPPTVDNLIRPKVNAIRGEEIDKRVDPVARPRTPDAEDSAIAMTDALRFVEEDQSVDELGGDVLLDLVVTGLGGAIVEVDGEDGYRCVASRIPWNQLAIDTRSRRRDTEDAKWKANIQWFDLDDAIETYPESRQALENACSHAYGADDDTTEDRPKRWFDSKRKRIRVVEMYYRSGKDWYRCDFTGSSIELREPSPSAYVDPRTGRPYCPIVAVRCYVDEENNPQGPVHDMISPQDEVNKRKSKALFQLSADQMIYEEGTVLDPQEAQREKAKPDGAVMVQPGALQNGRIQFTRNTDLAQGQVMLLQEAKQAIQAVGGASASLPDLPQSVSGRAFLARQKSATRELGPLFEIFGRFRTSVYWHIYGCIKQFWTDELWLRVTDNEETAGYRWVGLNRNMTRGQRLQELLQEGVALPTALQTAAGDEADNVMQRVQQMHQFMSQQAMMARMPPPGGEQHMLSMIMQDPAMQEPIIHNRVAEAMVDITIHDAPESAVLEDEEFGKLSEIMPTIVSVQPQLAPLFLKMLIKLSAFRDKREVLKEMDKPPEPQQAQQQQVMQQMQMAGVQAGIDVQKTQAQLNAAKAASEQAKMQQSGVKVPSEIKRNEAGAMKDAALAGAHAGGR